MAADLDALLDDLAAESADFRSLLTGVASTDWSAATPAAGWTVRDQVAHVWFFDVEARRALQDPAEFTAGLAAIASDPDGYMARHLDAGRAHGDRLLEEFDVARTQLEHALRSVDASARVPWYGPPMSPASFATARLMETWAHGQDVADGLAVRRVPSDRLRHVCHLGVRTRSFSYAVRDLTPPVTPISVVLSAPSGSIWSWGDADAADRIEGSALDFALVVTQRRHPSDVDLVVTGESAAQWMATAQAFAGAPSLTDARRRGAASA